MDSETSISLAEAFAECDGQMHQAAAPSFVTHLLKDGQRLSATALLDGARRAIEPRWWQSAKVSFETNSAVFLIDGRSIHATEIALDSEAWSRELANVTLPGFRDLRLEDDPAVRRKQQAELARHLASSNESALGSEQGNDDASCAPLHYELRKLLERVEVGQAKNHVRHELIQELGREKLVAGIRGHRDDCVLPGEFWTTADGKPTPAAKNALIRGVANIKLRIEGSDHLVAAAGIVMISIAEFWKFAKQFLPPAPSDVGSVRASDVHQHADAASPDAGTLAVAPTDGPDRTTGDGAKKPHGVKRKRKTYWGHLKRFMLRPENANLDEDSAERLFRSVYEKPGREPLPHRRYIIKRISDTRRPPSQ